MTVASLNFPGEPSSANASLNVSGESLKTDEGSSNNKTYQWAKIARNQLLASFFYGYAATQFLGSLVSSYFGPKRTIAFCLMLSSVLVLICPVIEKFGLIPLSIVRVLLGVLSSPLFSSKNILVGAWSPCNERSVINCFVHSGVLIGIVIGNIVGGLMCTSSYFIDGWKYFLYASGVLNALTVIIWLAFVSDSPQNHPWVSPSEKQLIQNSTLQTSEPLSKAFKKIPFKQIFTSLQVWLQTLALFGHYSIMFTLLVSLPVFLRDVCNVSNDKASYYSSIPFCGFFVVLVSYPILIDYLRNKRDYSVTKLRRFSSGLAFIGSFVFLVPVGYVPNDNPLYPLLLISAAMCFLGCNCTGFLTAAIDMAPKYVGIVVGINNSFGSTTGFIVQLVSGKLIEVQGDVIGWRYTFIFIAISGILFGLPFVFFGSSELQDWAQPQTSKKDNYREELL